MFIYNMLYAQFGALTPLMIVGGLGLILIVSVLPFLLIKPAEPFEKVKTQRVGRDEREARQSAGAAALRREEKVDKLQKFANFLEPQNTTELNEARLQMMRAGYRGKNAVRMYHFLQLALGITGLTLGGFYIFVKSLNGDVALQDSLIYILGGGAVGFYFPKFMVTRSAQTRKEEIIRGFPDALDLLLVSIEAGQSLDQSINRIAKEARASYPALADEFDIVSQEIKAGKERPSVLKDMSLRIDVPDISSFVSTLVQSATFGTSMAEALRMYSAEMREKRMSRAEEAANQVPTKLTMASMLFTLPPMLVILLAPSVYQMMVK